MSDIEGKVARVKRRGSVGNDRVSNAGTKFRIFLLSLAISCSFFASNIRVYSCPFVVTRQGHPHKPRETVSHKEIEGQLITGERTLASSGPAVGTCYQRSL